MMASDPIYKKLYGELRGSQMPPSMVDGKWVPSRKSLRMDLERIERNAGRYPVGFRHYESYVNYRMQYPKATLIEYQNAMSEHISFDEYYDISCRHYIYECNHDPQTHYK